MEHVMHCEETDYSQILKPDNLFTGKTAGKDRVTLSSAFRSSNNFHHGPNSYFEFTHIDPQLDSGRMTLEKRVNRQLELRSADTEKIFFYHHRSTNGFKHHARKVLKQAAIVLEQKYKSAYFVYFTQFLVDTSVLPRGYTLEIHNENQIFLTFLTSKHWAGNDLADFWARRDNDLLGSALSSCAYNFGVPDRCRLKV